MDLIFRQIDLEILHSGPSIQLLSVRAVGIRKWPILCYCFTFFLKLELEAVKSNHFSLSEKLSIGSFMPGFTIFGINIEF